MMGWCGWYCVRSTGLGIALRGRVIVLGRHSGYRLIQVLAYATIPSTEVRCLPFGLSTNAILALFISSRTSKPISTNQPR